MKRLLGAVLALVVCAALHATVNDFSRDEFQFTFGFDNPLSVGGKKSAPHSTVYLYVPVAAKKLRALLLLQQNVIEQRISVDPAIRRMCDANGVAIAWCSPGFDLVFTSQAARLHALIQEQFGRFGRTIGYPELGTVPLVAFGHSNTTAYVQNGAEARPDRVLAAVVTHGWNGVNHLDRYHGPVLVFIGSYWEFKQQAAAIDANKGVAASLTEIEKRLKRGWMPLSLAEEYGSGHFDYSEPMVELFAQFIAKAIKARLAPDGSLRDIDPNSGYIAGITEFPNLPVPIKPYAEGSAEEKAAWPWYFDRELAETVAKEIAGNGSWHRAAQFIGFKEPNGSLAPYHRSGLVDPVPYQIIPGTNEIRIFPELLSAFPPGFAKAGQPIGRADDRTITLEYDCGPYLYRDLAGVYRVKLNRNGFSGYIVARNLGDSRFRPAVQPTRLLLGTPVHSPGGETEDGTALRWPLPPAPIQSPGDQKSGARIALPKSAVSDEYLGYYVDHGPARVVGDELQILPLPANTSGAWEVQLTAYRLGQTLQGLSSVTFHVSN